MAMSRLIDIDAILGATMPVTNSLHRVMPDKKFCTAPDKKFCEAFKNCIVSGQIEYLWTNILTASFCADPPHSALSFIFERHFFSGRSGMHYASVVRSLVQLIPSDVLRRYIASGKTSSSWLLFGPLVLGIILNKCAPDDDDDHDDDHDEDHDEDHNEDHDEDHDHYQQQRIRRIVAHYCVTFCDQIDVSTGKPYVEAVMERFGVTWECIWSEFKRSVFEHLKPEAIVHILPYIGAEESPRFLATACKSMRYHGDMILSGAATCIVSRLLDTIITASLLDTLFDGYVTYSIRDEHGTFDYVETRVLMGTSLMLEHDDVIVNELFTVMEQRHWERIIEHDGAFLALLSPELVKNGYDRLLLILSSMPEAVKRSSPVTWRSDCTVAELFENTLMEYYQDTRELFSPEELLCAVRIPATTEAAPSE